MTIFGTFVAESPNNHFNFNVLFNYFVRVWNKIVLLLKFDLSFEHLVSFTSNLLERNEKLNFLIFWLISDTDCLQKLDMSWIDCHVHDVVRTEIWMKLYFQWEAFRILQTILTALTMCFWLDNKPNVLYKFILIIRWGTDWRAKTSDSWIKTPGSLIPFITGD